MSISYVKGQFVPAENAVISVQERGLRYGDGLFESIKIQQGKARHLHRPLRRMEAGLKTLRFRSLTTSLEQVCTALIEQNNASEGILRLSVSRGIGSDGYLPTVREEPTIIGEIMPLPEFNDEPINLWLANWQKPSLKALPVEAKIANGLNSTLARLEAYDNDCQEALMLNAQGAICEASSANIFWRIGGLIYTPSAKCGILKGIAREILIEKLQVHQGAFDLDSLINADSVMICNSIRGAMPVVSLQPNRRMWADDSLAERAQKVLDEA